MRSLPVIVTKKFIGVRRCLTMLLEIALVILAGMVGFLWGALLGGEKDE